MNDHDYRIHDLSSAPAGSKTILAQLEQQVGFIPNLAASMAESPTLIDGFTSLRRVVGQSSLEPIEREVVALTVSVVNRCTYCVAAHSTFAAKHGASPALLQALRARQPVEDRRLEALRSFVEAVVSSHGPLTIQQKHRLRDAGYDRGQVLEVLAVIAMASLANHAHHVTEAPVDDAFAARVWAIPAEEQDAAHFG